MSPSRAGSSQGSSWTIFSSDRLGSWPFPSSSGISLLRLENRQNTRLFLSTLLFLRIGEIALNSECTWLNMISLVASKKSDKKKGVKRGAGKSPELKKSQDLQKTPRTFGLLYSWDVLVRLGFSSEIEVPQLGSARLGTFIARLGSSCKIPARAHH